MRQERNLNELTQERLAGLADLSLRNIQRVEAGEINVLMTTWFSFAKHSVVRRTSFSLGDRSANAVVCRICRDADIWIILTSQWLHVCGLFLHCTVGQMRRLANISDAFAAAVKEHRLASGLTQKALAEKADLHPTYISLVERFLRTPRLDVAESLAKALGISLSKLIAEAEKIQRRGKPQ